MAKVDYAKEMELQRLLKENTTLKNKIQNSNEKELSLKEKIENLEKNLDNLSLKSIEKLSLSKIILTENIRDEYQYEEIENLANNILKHEQIQPVLITKDNYLLAGYRRYNAVKMLNENPELFNIPDKKTYDLVCYRTDLTISDFNEEKIQELQFSENEQRKAIDHFQISKLFNRYIEKGYEQKYICEKFSKKKSYVSSVLSLKNIDSQLVKWIKEFQVYSWSKDKFNKLTTVNRDNIDENIHSFYEKNKGIIGWNMLYQISKHKDINEQKKTFLKLFQNRLSEEEINSKYFKGIKEDKKNKNDIESVKKYIKKFSKMIEVINVSPDKKKYLEKINKNVSELEKLFEDLIK